MPKVRINRKRSFAAVLPTLMGFMIVGSIWRLRADIKDDLDYDAKGVYRRFEVLRETATVGVNANSHEIDFTYHVMTGGIAGGIGVDSQCSLRQNVTIR